MTTLQWDDHNYMPCLPPCNEFDEVKKQPSQVEKEIEK